MGRIVDAQPTGPARTADAHVASVVALKRLQQQDSAALVLTAALCVAVLMLIGFIRIVRNPRITPRR